MLYAGVYIHLKGKNYTNNSVISISDVGVGADALLCITDVECCCAIPGHRYGSFYYPNKTSIPGPHEREGDSMYLMYHDSEHKMIRLNRNSEMNLTGKYHCEIPDASGVIQKLYFTLQLFVCQ